MSDLLQTHHDECWRQRRHHDCAVGKIERLTNVLEYARNEIRDGNKRIAELEAQLKATEANEQVLVDANKPLLVRIAELEGVIKDTISSFYTNKPPYYQIHFEVGDMLEAALENNDDTQCSSNDLLENNDD